MPATVRIADADTIERARTGDSDAMSELWRIYHPQILRFLRAKRSPCVDDIASQVWIDAGRSIDRFAGDGVGMQRWLFTIANRRSIDELRRVVRRKQVTDDGLCDQWKKTNANEIDRFDEIESAIALLRQLPQKTAEAVMLRVVFDLSVADAAAVLGCSEGNVRVLAHRGLNRLRELLGDDRGGASVSGRRAAVEVGGGAGRGDGSRGVTIAAAGDLATFSSDL